MDKSRYPPDWDERCERIIARDKVCKHCDAVSGDPLPGRIARAFVNGLFGGTLQVGPNPYFVILTVAHLDRDENNWDVSDDRLATLCQQCHLRYDAPDNHKRRKYGRTSRDQQLSINL